MDVLLDGEIVLYGTVGDDFWDEGFTAQDVLRALAEVGRGTDVIVRINSPGGYVSDGVSIYNALKAHRGRVTVYVDALAASAASVIAMAGDEIIMRTGSIMMIHDPAGVTIGDVREHEKAIVSLDKLGDAIADIYSERTGRAADEIRDQMRDELWLTADEAVAQKFADRLDAANENAVAIEPAVFNYRLYQNAPERFVALAEARAWDKRELKAAKPAATNSQQEHPMATTPAGTKPATPPTEPTSTEPSNVVNIDEARASGRSEALAYVREITEICALAGQPDKAMAFIEKEAKAADVRKELLDARASADAARTITNTIPPNGTSAPASGGLKATMLRQLGKGA
ncbi:head maturation protease, ClpP-related [Microvirga sp. P5_D2]